jgi:uncharacterized membrane protein YoaK (UPF0700 family)
VDDPNKEPVGVVWQPRITYALAISLLPHVGFVVLWIAINGNPSGSATFALLAIWAMAMGMQSAAIRWLNVRGVFTTAATATFIFSLESLARRRLTAEERGRLLGVLVSLVIGATGGARLLMKAPIYTPLLPFIITVIVVAIAAKAFAYGDKGNALG